MEIVDRLLSILIGPDRSTATRQLMAAGYTEDEVEGAWNFARAAGYTESTGLGMDRLTPAGRARTEQIRSSRRRARPTERTSGLGRTEETRTMGAFAGPAGAPERMGGRRSAFGRLLPFAVAVVTASTLVAACDGSGDGAPTRLMDGSLATELPVDLEGVEGQAVLTSVTIPAAVDMDGTPKVATCLQNDWKKRPFGAIVVRVGVSGESVTFRDQSRRGLYGCDNSEGPREEDRSWCGGAFGPLYADHLRDPRLDLGACTTRDDRPLGFAWIEARPDVEYVVVEQSGYAEVYPVAGGLPIRVTTSDVEHERSRAAFEVSEHRSDGTRIHNYRLEASVAG